MQRWGWSCAQNKCGFGKLPIGRAFVMNGGDGQTKINLLKNTMVFMPHGKKVSSC